MDKMTSFVEASCGLVPASLSLPCLNRSSPQPKCQIPLICLRYPPFFHRISKLLLKTLSRRYPFLIQMHPLQ